MSFAICCSRRISSNASSAERREKKPPSTISPNSLTMSYFLLRASGAHPCLTLSFIGVIHFLQLFELCESCYDVAVNKFQTGFSPVWMPWVRDFLNREEKRFEIHVLFVHCCYVDFARFLI